MVSSVGETFDDLPMFLAEVHESRAYFVSTAALSQRDATDLDLGRKWLSRQVEAQTPAAPFFCNVGSTGSGHRSD